MLNCCQAGWMLVRPGARRSPPQIDAVLTPEPSMRKRPHMMAGGEGAEEGEVFFSGAGGLLLGFSGDLIDRRCAPVRLAELPHR